MHNVFGERWMGLKKPAWHDISKGIWTEPVSAPVAVVQCDADYEVVLAEATATFERDGETITVPVTGSRTVLREPVEGDMQWRDLGTVGKNFGLIQNTQICAAIDKAVPDLPVESIGVLGKGETFFVCLRTAPMDILGDEVRNYFLIVDGKAGNQKLSVVHTPIRTECENTLMMGLDAALMSVDVRHTGDIESELEFTVDLMALMERSQVRIKENFELLAKTKITADDVATIAAAAFPLPNVPRKVQLINSIPADELGGKRVKRIIDSESYKVSQADFASSTERAKMLRVETLTQFGEFNDNFPQFAMTGWSAYNGVTALASHRDGRGASKSVLFGTRAAESSRAYATAMAIANGEA